MQKRLHRSRTERMVAGVCGGLAEYFGIDPTIVRVLWVLMVLLAGTGVLLYLILWIIVPLDTAEPPGQYGPPKGPPTGPPTGYRPTGYPPSRY